MGLLSLSLLKPYDDRRFWRKVVSSALHENASSLVQVCKSVGRCQVLPSYGSLFWGSASSVRLWGTALILTCMPCFVSLLIQPWYLCFVRMHRTGVRLYKAVRSFNLNVRRCRKRETLEWHHHQLLILIDERSRETCSESLSVLNCATPTPTPTPLTCGWTEMRAPCWSGGVRRPLLPQSRRTVKHACRTCIPKVTTPNWRVRQTDALNYQRHSARLSSLQKADHERSTCSESFPTSFFPQRLHPYQSDLPRQRTWDRAIENSRFSLPI